MSINFRQEPFILDNNAIDATAIKSSHNMFCISKDELNPQDILFVIKTDFRGKVKGSQLLTFDRIDPAFPTVITLESSPEIPGLSENFFSSSEDNCGGGEDEDISNNISTDILTNSVGVSKSPVRRRRDKGPKTKTPNAFILYRCNKQQELLRCRPGSQAKDLSVVIAKMWAEEPKEIKEIYKENAKKLRRGMNLKTNVRNSVQKYIQSTSHKPYSHVSGSAPSSPACSGSNASLSEPILPQSFVDSSQTQSLELLLSSFPPPKLPFNIGVSNLPTSLDYAGNSTFNTLPNQYPRISLNNPPIIPSTPYTSHIPTIPYSNQSVPNTEALNTFDFRPLLLNPLNAGGNCGVDFSTFL
ncbi:hypothetical protein AX774_g1762 [Zancudomyces culisetae]|uniref:HMG box domain-containing protein n=1 Tax=Zancudomyces culisetae TaxID=1213189 RepID=A0A1R1PUR9_ZANCU|nr:hypothetical protein AX774_g1762 [Zancudomyces culisetae]|eukprot:OMH84715.1 hypothetical protein AX774_g1762 [Zancudomyces culisetae]